MQSTLSTEVASGSEGSPDRWHPYTPGVLYEGQFALMKTLLAAFPAVAMLFVVVVVCVGKQGESAALSVLSLWAALLGGAFGLITYMARDVLIRGRPVLFSKGAAEYALEHPYDTPDTGPLAGNYKLDYPILRVHYGAWRWLARWNGQYLRANGMTPLSLRVEIRNGQEVIAWKLDGQVIWLPPQVMLRLLEAVEESRHRSMRVSVHDTIKTLLVEHREAVARALACAGTLERELVQRSANEMRIKRLESALADALEIGQLLASGYASREWVVRRGDIATFRTDSIRALHGLAIVLEGEQMVDRAFEPHHLALVDSLGVNAPAAEVLVRYMQKQASNCAKGALFARDHAFVEERRERQADRREVEPLDVRRPEES